MMKQKILLPLFLLLFVQVAIGQLTTEKFSEAMMRLEADPVFKSAIVGCEIREVSSGKSIFAYHSQKGLVPASTQKIITAAAMLEKFGKDFKYKTSFFLQQHPDNKVTLNVVGSYDPSLGSNRWEATRSEIIISGLINKLIKAGIQHVDTLLIANPEPGRNLSPKWIWEDMGNYYGAAAETLNWKENKFEIHLRSGTEIGSSVQILKHDGPRDLKLLSELTVGKKGSGDQAYVFHAPNDSIAYVRGTIPAGEDDFVIIASIFGPQSFITGLQHDPSGIFDGVISKCYFPGSVSNEGTLIFEHESPELEHLIYCFLKKSINLYGESFLLTFGNGLAKNGTDTIFSMLRKAQIDTDGISIFDGSGLSPENRVSPQMLVSTMLFARKQNWWPVFYNALPEINGMHMKDGYITGYRCYTGIHTQRNGKEYVFALIANNYNGSSAVARQKLWDLLNLLK